MKNEQSQGKLDQLSERLEFNRFGLSTALITIQSCVGSIAVGFLFRYGFGADSFLIFCVAATTMAANVTIISVSPMKWILKSAALSLIVSMVVIGYAVINGNSFL